MYKYIFKRIDEAKGRRMGTSAGQQLRDGYPKQETFQGKNVKLDSFFLSFDEKLAKRRDRLREELNEIKRKASLYNRPVSTDNDL